MRQLSRLCSGSFRIGEPDNEISLDELIEDALILVAERNPDFYQVSDGRLLSAD